MVCVALLGPLGLGCNGLRSGGSAAPGSLLRCAPDNGGLRLPEGFCATRVATGLGPVRHLAVAANGDVFAAVRGEPGVVALRDTDGDGIANRLRRFGPGIGQGLASTRGSLYLSTHDRVVRWRMEPGRLAPVGGSEPIVVGFPAQREHAAKAIALGFDGSLFVSIGAPSNSCQVRNREPGSPGQEPCPDLEAHAGVWRYAADRLNQQAADSEPFATGMRHTLALAIQPATGRLYAAVHGRDMLGALWGFGPERNAELPAEEFVRVARGDNYGWPYCYYDGLAKRRVLAPEYGGDGKTIGRCREMTPPQLAFPAHWAPMALVFYPHERFGPEYAGGAFLAFHGSWNRAPLPQEGFRVVFVPFRDGQGTDAYFTFAIGASDPTAIRPSGLAIGPDGSLYIAADANQTIWRVWRKRPAGAAPTR